MSATAPAAEGQAMDVPEIARRPQSASESAAQTPAPGVNTSGLRRPSCVGPLPPLACALKSPTDSSMWAAATPTTSFAFSGEPSGAPMAPLATAKSTTLSS